jgi:hypothetical protein
MRNECVLLGVEVRLKNRLENLSVDGSIRNLTKVGHEDADWIDEAQDGDRMTDCCEQGNEHSDSNNYANNSRHN